MRGERRYRRKAAGAKRWSQIIGAKGADGCRLCGKRPVTFHHVVPKGAPYFGDDTESNVVGLCGDGVRGCHGAIEARDPVKSRSLCEALDDAEYAYAITHGGENFLERRYGLTYSRP